MSNVMQILEIVGKNKSNFSEMCKDHGIKIDKSVFTRHDNGQVMGIDKLDEMVKGINLFDGYRTVTATDLLNPSLFSKEHTETKTRIETADLKKVIAKYLLDLDELGWCVLKTEMPLETMTDFAVLAFKNYGFDIIKSPVDQSNEKSA